MKIAALALFFCAIVPGAASADEIVLPAGILERGKSADVVYRVDPPATGRGTLSIAWTDSAGRVVDRRRLPVALDGSSDIRFSLDLARAVAMNSNAPNQRSARVAGDGPKARGKRARMSATLVTDRSAKKMEPWMHTDARR